MHTGVIFAVEAESPQDAISDVEVYIENGMVPWSDWGEHEGRWAGVLPEGGVLCYTDNPEEFNRIVGEFLSQTEDEELRLLKDVGHLSIEELISDPRYNLDFTMSNEEFEAEKIEVAALSSEERTKRSVEKLSRYKAVKLLRMNGSEFMPETHFWDAEWDTRYRNRMDERIAKNPSQQYLVIWDFHF